MSFPSVPAPEKLHTRITRTLARRLLQSPQILTFPKEADLCAQLGVSRTVLRESMKVLVDKGMVEMKPRAGTRSRPRSAWRRLDPDILAWQAETDPSPAFLRDLCEVRLAIEPTAAGFAAVRATPAELDAIDSCVRQAATSSFPTDRIVDLDLEFHSALVAASHNPLLVELSETIRTPIRTVMACTARFAATVELGAESRQSILDCLRRRDPIAARRAAEEAVGLAMLAVEKAIRSQESPAKEQPSGRPRPAS
jgi:GntR family transcriptional regulator, galactonate operon transcriptional repressor